MSLSVRTLSKSFRYAWRGLVYTYRNEQNFRIQMFVASIVILLMFTFRVKEWEAVALIFVIASVLTLEILNTVVERLVDLLKPRLHHYVEIIKDMMAALVFLVSLGSFLVGFIIFLPYILSLW